MDKKKRALPIGIVVLVIVFILFLIGGFIFFVRREGRHLPVEAISKEASTPNKALTLESIPDNENIRSPDTVRQTQPQNATHRLPGLSKRIAEHQKGNMKGALVRENQAASNSGASSQEKAIDSAAAAESECEKDTTSPWGYTDPSGGLHHTAISVKLFATKPCAIEWKLDSAGTWNDYAGEPIRIEKSTILYLQATDSCGNSMEPREERYDLRPEDSVRYCPEDMEHVRVGQTSFCIDKYEWPNVKGRLPRTYVSVYQAMDTCASTGKRLCTSDEWTIACTGPYGWKYPYGAAYELYACVTNDTTVRPSGARPECRGYFGLFDMSGNCAEWTSTRSSINMHFFNVMGGFWESGPQSGCFDVRYSYFPQNRHNPVGFRCCKDARPD